MICPECGARLHEEARFCSNCGVRITPPPGDAAAPSQVLESEFQIPTSYEPVSQGYGAPPQEPRYPPFEYGQRENVRYDTRPPQKKAGMIIGLSILIIIIILSAIAISSLNLFPGEAGKGKPDDHAVISDYFSAFESGDTDKINSLILPELITYFTSSGYLRHEIPGQIDLWSQDYGGRVRAWLVVSVTELDFKDTILADIGMDPSEISRIVNVTVEAEIERYGYDEEMIIDFDLVFKNKGWYLAEVW